MFLHHQASEAIGEHYQTSLPQRMFEARICECAFAIGTAFSVSLTGVRIQRELFVKCRGVMLMVHLWQGCCEGSVSLVEISYVGDCFH